MTTPQETNPRTEAPGIPPAIEAGILSTGPVPELQKKPGLDAGTTLNTASVAVPPGTVSPGNLPLASRPPPHLNPLLASITDWPEHAHKAGYSPVVLAKNRGVSLRSLEFFFAQLMHDTPRACLHRWRMERAAKLLAEGKNVKQTAALVGYADPSHFSTNFKRFYGQPPKQHAKAN